MFHNSGSITTIWYMQNFRYIECAMHFVCNYSILCSLSCYAYEVKYHFEICIVQQKFHIKDGNNKKLIFLIT